MKTYAELEKKDASDHLYAVAKAFVDAGRTIPSHILRRLWGLRSEWKRKKNIPQDIVAACEKLDRTEGA